MKRKILVSFGSKGHRLARVYGVGPKEFLVERWVRGRLRRKTFTDRKAATVFAKVWYEKGLESEVESIGLRELFDRYIDMNSDQRKWRPKTLLLRQAERKRIEAVLTPDLAVATLNPSHLDTLWMTLKGQGVAESQLQRYCQFLRHVAAWGHSRDYIPHAKLAGWHAPTVATPQVAEYTPDEVGKLLAYLRRDPRGVRAHAALLFAQSQGIRANAMLHLRWEDVGPVWIQLRAAFDKTKRDWQSGTTWDGWAALEEMRAYQLARGITSPWVFHGKDPKQPYTYYALWLALQKAEKATGVQHLPRRALHGMRRHAVNEAREHSGDASLAMMSVGDRDMKQAISYVRPREEELLAVANRLPTVSISKAPDGASAKSLQDNGIHKPTMGLEPMTPNIAQGSGAGVSHIPHGVTTAERRDGTPENSRNAQTNRPGTVFRPMPRPAHVHPDAVPGMGAEIPTLGSGGEG